MQALENAVKDYRSGKLSLDAFEQWFRDNSRGMFGESGDVLEACLAIESAFSLLRFDDVSEDEFREELAEAIRPFASRAVENLAQISLESHPVLLSFDRAFDQSERRSSNFLAIEFQDEKHGVTNPARRGSNVSRDDQPKSAWSAGYFRREYPGYRISNRDSYSVTSEHSKLNVVLVNV